MIKLIANYAKRLGLPGYSSHQFSVSVETELASTDDIQAAAARLYTALQTNVDEQIQSTGFVPPHGYGLNGEASRLLDVNEHSRNGNHNGHTLPPNGHGRSANGNGHRPSREESGISEKQLDLVNEIVRKNNANKGDIEDLSVEMFGGGVRTLNRLQASNFIDALFERYPRANANGAPREFQRQPVRSR